MTHARMHHPTRPTGTIFVIFQAG